MNLDRIEEIINLVKSNDVKKFKYKDFENEIELDFTEGTATQAVAGAPSVQAGENTMHNHHLHKLKANQHQMLKKSNLQW